MNQSDRFRLNCGGDLISYTQGESVPRGLIMFIAGLILAGLAGHLASDQEDSSGIQSHKLCNQEVCAP